MTHHERVHRSHDVTTTNQQARQDVVALRDTDGGKRIGAPAGPDEVVPGAWETDGGRVGAPGSASSRPNG